MRSEGRLEQRRFKAFLVYAATAVGGDLCADEECLEAALFESTELPWDELAFHSTRDALRDYLNGVLHPYKA